MTRREYPRCALFDDPPTALTVVQKAISEHGPCPSVWGWWRERWHIRYNVLRDIEDRIAQLEEARVRELEEQLEKVPWNWLRLDVRT